MMRTKGNAILCIALTVLGGWTGFAKADPPMPERGSASTLVDEPADTIRLGIIGLDTSHVIAFTKIINDPKKKSGCRVTAAFPGGSPDFPSSANRVDGYTRQLQDKHEVEIVRSIEELCTRVDGILLESLDGRPHLEQARIVIAAGKPLFIDKPVAHNLSDAIELYRLAKEHNVPCWSSSAYRFGEGIVDARQNEALGGVVGCDVYGSSSWAEFHPDLYLYGIHAAEALFTVMGPGCRQVQRIKTDNGDLVIGTWNDGRIGTFRDPKQGKAPGLAVIYGSKTSVIAKAPGYDPLVAEIVKFFKTRKAPVTTEETIEIYAFMSAADESKAKSGAPIALPDLIERASQRSK